MWIVTTSSLRSCRIAVPNAFAAIQDYYEAQGWTDGLPRLPGQCGDRTGVAAGDSESGGADTWGDGQGHPGDPGALQLLLCGERSTQPLGTAPRRVGLCGQREHRHPDRGPGGLSGHGNDG